MPTPTHAGCGETHLRHIQEVKLRLMREISFSSTGHQGGIIPVRSSSAKSLTLRILFRMDEMTEMRSGGCTVKNA